MQPLRLVSETRPPVQRDRLLRLPDVEALTGCKKSTIYNLMRAGQFVQPVRISSRCTAWPESAVMQWVQDRIKAAQQAQPQAALPLTHRGQS